jgi:DNA-binding SARP family transcriptional activator/predicted ATPase
MEVYLLGQFQVKVDGEAITSLNHPRLQELLAYLLLQRGKGISRQHVAFLFWPDSSEEQARTNLRNLLHRLRRAFPVSDDFLVVDETHLQWRSDISLSVDVAEFEDAILQAESTQRLGQVEFLAQAARLYGGDLLPVCYSDWLLAERERLHQSYLSLLEKLAKLYEEQRAYSKAIQTIQVLLRQDPLNESAYARLMRLHTLGGNRGQALHIYHTCAEALARELNVAPGPELRALYEQLIQADAAQNLPAAPVSIAPVTPLIARQAEWKQLTGNWRGFLRDQRPLPMIWIAGEAGIGKTHMAQSFVAWVQRQGFQTAAAACYDGMRDLAYAPIAAWLTSLFEQDERLFDKLSPVWRLEISRLLPELQLRDPALGTPGSLSEKWQLLHFYDGLLQAFTNFHNPLLLFLDDVQWCDPETLAWLAYLQTKPSGEKVLLIATARSEAITVDHPALQLFNKSDQTMRLELEPLDEAETDLLVEQLVGEPVGAEKTQRIFRQSEGNPLFVTEMVRSGINQDLNGKGALPERIQAVIDWRLNRLSEPAYQVLELAAVIGRNFSYELLKEASYQEEQILVNSLDECWRQRILREQGGQDYDFSHDMLRQVAYDGLSQARRRLLHGRVAQGLEQVYASEPNLAGEQIAYHLELSGQVHRAILFYERAAQAARQLFALPQAVSFLEHALQLLRSAEASEQLVGRLHEQLGEILLISGQYEASRQNLSIAIQHLDPDDSVGRGRLLRLSAQTWSSQQRYAEAQEAIENALAVLGNQPPADSESPLMQEWLETRMQQIDCLYYQNRPNEMEAICKLLEGPLEQSGTLEQQADYCTLRGMLNNRHQRYQVTEETIQIVHRALELAEQLNDPLLIASKHFGMGFNLLWYWDRQEAIAHLDQALSLAEKLGATFIQNQALAYLAITYRLDDNREMVSQLARRGLALSEEESHPNYQGVALANLAWLAYRQGDLERAQRLAEKALPMWGYAGYPMEWLAEFVLAAIAMHHGQLRRAQKHLAAIIHPSQQRLPEVLETRLKIAANSNGKVDSVPVREAIQQALETASRLGYL